MNSVSRSQRRSRRGFSLVELVIVIVIIGVIAAIAIPRVGRAAKGAGESALASNLAIMRNVIELYSSQHDGVYPGANGDGVALADTAAAFLTQLTQYTKADGTVKATFDPANGFKFGPYLRKGIPPAPVGPTKGDTNVLMDNTGPAVSAANTSGWVYNSATGDIIVNSDAANESGDKTYDAY